MQTHVFKRYKIKAWNACPDANAVLYAATKSRATLNMRLKAQRMIKRLHAMAIAHRECAEVQERWHALVSFDDRSNPIKFVAMTRTEALTRNATIRDLRMEWVMRDR